MPVWIDPDYPATAVTATIPALVPTVTKVSAAGAPATGHPASRPATFIPLFVNATVAATSPVLDRGAYRGPAAIVLENIGTGSPAMSVDIEVSCDNVNFYNGGYALVATPNTVAVAQIAVTATATTTYLLVTDQAWRFIRLKVSAVTTETWSATYYQ